MTYFTTIMTLISWCEYVKQKCGHWLIAWKRELCCMNRCIKWGNSHQELQSWSLTTHTITILGWLHFKMCSIGRNLQPLCYNLDKQYINSWGISHNSVQWQSNFHRTKEEFDEMHSWHCCGSALLFYVYECDILRVGFIYWYMLIHTFFF